MTTVAPAGGTGRPELLCHVPLPGHRSLVVRRLEPADATALDELFTGLDADDVYRRFFSGHPPPPTFVARMADVVRRGGFGVVAEVVGAGHPPRLVAEAGYEVLPDGNGELGITVAREARGWLGPYLFDVLCREAQRRGVPNLEADVLVVNRRILALLGSRGLAVCGHGEQPATLRVVVSTGARVPSWPAVHDRPRVLVEVPGGCWRGEHAARQAGFDVLACPGPFSGWVHCPARLDQPCPLVVGADVVVDAVPGVAGRWLLGAHRSLHPQVPLCAALPPQGPAEPPVASERCARLPVDAEESAVAELLQRLAHPVPAAGA